MRWERGKEGGRRLREAEGAEWGEKAEQKKRGSGGGPWGEQEQRKRQKLFFHELSEKPSYNWLYMYVSPTGKR